PNCASPGTKCTSQRRRRPHAKNQCAVWTLPKVPPKRSLETGAWRLDFVAAGSHQRQESGAYVRRDRHRNRSSRPICLSQSLQSGNAGGSRSGAGKGSRNHGEGKLFVGPAAAAATDVGW
ncbi:unnamed protein product, partial [Ectocarpus fasciculatus]